jgi:DNA-binding XRE family transcriptional regulator
VTLIRLVDNPALLVRAQNVLGLSQAQLGQLLGCSRRTMVRWQKGENGPSLAQWFDLVRHVHGVSPELAAEIAVETGETLETLGIVRPPPPPAPVAPPPEPPRPPPLTSDLVDSIVCAAAEAVATTPQAIRPSVLAAFDRAASLGLAVDEVRATLRGARDAGRDEPSKKKAAR